MTPFKLFWEKRQRNPLRKKELKSSGVLDYDDPDLVAQYKDYYINSPYEELDPKDKVIQTNYFSMLSDSPASAERFLDTHVREKLQRGQRHKTKPYRKVYEYMGVQVFVDDENVIDQDYTPGSSNYNAVKNSVMVLLHYTKETLPNRRPKIVITSIADNEFTSKAKDPEAIGLAVDKLIFIDEEYMDEGIVWVHEYAHWVADLIPKQTQNMLIDAFQKLIDIQYKGKDAMSLTDGERAKIAKKLGFPEYGLTDHNEFFAVLIENWRMLPKTKLTYKFKSLVKKVLARL